MSPIEELNIALLKLKHYFYYEKNDLMTRTEVLAYKKDDLKLLVKLLSDSNNAEDFLSDISINLYPKKVEPKKDEGEINEENLFSNEHLSKGTKITEFLKMASVPVELHIISVVWLMRYGSCVDSSLSKNAFGNRMERTDNGVPNRKIFRNYISQYENWWNAAIKTCKEQLDNKRDVLMVNFDIRSFYNNVDFNFIELENLIDQSDNKSDEAYSIVSEDPVHKIIRDIHSVYSSIYSKTVKSERKESLTVLPIGMLTSFVFANWYLKEIDSDILELDPVFYGRYVDDFILVFQGNSNLKYKTVEDVLKEKLHIILSPKNSDEKEFSFVRRKTLFLQKDKTYIYKFSYKYPPSLLDKFISDQKERASEFRYLSDEEDENFEDFDKVTFEQNFGLFEGNKARFKVLEENKFKMSSYFAKLIVRKVKNPKKYKKEEVDKIYKFFKGYYLIRHYQFWEKIITILIVYEEYDKLRSIIEEINQEIDNSELCLSTGNNGIYKPALKKYLANVLKQVIVLKPRGTFSKDFATYQNKYLTTLRSHYCFYPWLQYTKLAKRGVLDLTDREVYSKHNFKKNDLDIDPTIIPYRVKFYYSYMQQLYKKLYTKAYE